MTPALGHPLVLIDERPESERALEVAAALATAGAGRVSAIDVLEPLPGWVGDGADASLLALAEQARAAHAERLETLAARWAARGLAVTPRVAWGTPSVEVIREAVDARHDVVVKVARGGQRLGWPLFGSVAQHLVRKCPTPVWLVAPERPTVPRRVLAVVMPEPGAPEPGALELRVLGLAREVAARCGAAFDVVRPWRVSLGRGLPASRDAVAALAGLRAAAQEAFAKLVAAADLDPRRALFLDGSPAEAVAEVAGATGVDLIVIGTVGRAAALGLLIREDAEDLLNRVACSVLAVKPAQFATPVRLADG